LEDLTEADFEAMRQYILSQPPSPERELPAGEYLQCWDPNSCLVQFVQGWNHFKANMWAHADNCCRDLAIYFKKQMSQGLNMMWTSGGGSFAPVLMYFATLAVCALAGSAVSAALTPATGAAAKITCEVFVTASQANFWWEVGQAESNGTCLALRIYWIGQWVPIWGTEGGEKCRW
jgi:hypothetical protein